MILDVFASSILIEKRKRPQLLPGHSDLRKLTRKGETLERRL